MAEVVDGSSRLSGWLLLLLAVLLFGVVWCGLLLAGRAGENPVGEPELPAYAAELFTDHGWQLEDVMLWDDSDGGHVRADPLYVAVLKHTDAAAAEQLLQAVETSGKFTEELGEFIAHPVVHDVEESCDGEPVFEFLPPIENGGGWKVAVTFSSVERLSGSDE